MTEFSCSKHLHKCKAQCCGAVPIDLETFELNVDKIQNKIIHSSIVSGTDPISGKTGDYVIPFTENLDCCFLTANCDCAIYDRRPPICKEFGKTNNPNLQCQYQRMNGEKRPEKEQKEIQKKLKKILSKYIKMD